ncbi:hypothetical protein IAR55_001505 [Kwoniella newhampshirensis]|uniref:BZIP domain-containing protein n=1 Tax=Kwoniella newhampshirensis TaxID=1651941 RepID=A0AAW0Z2E4_9TREE
MFHQNTFQPISHSNARPKTWSDFPPTVEMFSPIYHSHAYRYIPQFNLYRHDDMVERSVSRPFPTRSSDPLVRLSHPPAHRLHCPSLREPITTELQLPTSSRYVDHRHGRQVGHLGSLADIALAQASRLPSVSRPPSKRCRTSLPSLSTVLGHDPKLSRSISYQGSQSCMAETGRVRSKGCEHSGGARGDYDARRGLTPLNTSGPLSSGPSSSQSILRPIGPRPTKAAPKRVRSEVVDCLSDTEDLSIKLQPSATDPSSPSETIYKRTKRKRCLEQPTEAVDVGNSPKQNISAGGDKGSVKKGRRNVERRRLQNAVAQRKFRVKKKDFAAKMESDLESATSTNEVLRRQIEERDELIAKLQAKMKTMGEEREEVKT